MNKITIIIICFLIGIVLQVSIGAFFMKQFFLTEFKDNTLYPNEAYTVIVNNQFEIYKILNPTENVEQD